MNFLFFCLSISFALFFFIENTNHKKNIIRVIHDKRCDVIPERPTLTYERIGHLTNTTNNQILPLFGKPTNYRSYHWNYYTLHTISDFQQAYIPVEVDQRNCLETFGCREIYTDDIIHVNKSPHHVTLYANLVLP